MPVRKRIKAIVKDLKDAYEAWKQLQPGNQVLPPEDDLVDEASRKL
jgi:hypothetical protein